MYNINRKIGDKKLNSTLFINILGRSLFIFMCYNLSASKKVKALFKEPSKMKTLGFRKSLIAVMLVAAFVLAGTACDKKITSSDTVSTGASTVDPLSYAAIDAKMRDYAFNVNEYMREHSAEAYQKVTNGKTIGGIDAKCTYTLSHDKKYEVLQMEKDIGNGHQVDEYFNMGDSMFVARTTIYDDGHFDPVYKYYVVDGALYKIDIDNKTVTKLAILTDSAIEEMQANIDIYLSFEDIRTLYA